MALKKMITILCFNLFTLSALSQNQNYAEDSVIAQRLIADKLQSLEALNIANYLYLFSDVGTIVILYEEDGKIKAVRSQYKGKSSSKFKKLKLSKEDKSNFNKCMNMASKDTTVRFSSCNDIVHSFSRVVFSANQSQHYIKGSFTSDCLGILDKNGMSMLGGIYKHLLIM